MIVENREKFLKKMKLNSNINRFIFAKSLFSLGDKVSDDLLQAVANVVINRFVYEAEISEKLPDIVLILISHLFPSWKNVKYMDSIDISDSRFKKCLRIAAAVLEGECKDNIDGAIGFHKVGQKPAWTCGFCPFKVIDDFYFYNNCV